MKGVRFTAKPQKFPLVLQFREMNQIRSKKVKEDLIL